MFQSCVRRVVIAFCFISAGTLMWLTAPAATRSPAQADDSSPNQPSDRVAVRDSREPDLCDALVQQAEKAAESRETFCSLPSADAELGFERPEWTPVDPASLEPLLRRYLPLFGWDTRGVQTLIEQSMPQASREELLAEHWKRYGAAMMDALRSGHGLLESAVMDVDNDGSTERVYRTAVLRPVDKGRPELGWQPLPCNLSGDAPTEGVNVIPYRALFFEESKQGDMGTMADFDKIEAKDLFLFKGRTYLTRMSPSSTFAASIRAQKLPGTRQKALYHQVCLIDRRL